MFRKMRRFKQQLTDDACAEVLKNGQRGILAVLGDEGYPYTVPLDYVYTDGKLYFHSAAEGHKVDAVRAEPKASFCVLAQREQDADGWSYYFDSVVVFGKVQIIEDEEYIAKTTPLLPRCPTEDCGVRWRTQAVPWSQYII